jgi:hypothetical protein
MKTIAMTFVFYILIMAIITTSTGISTHKSDQQQAFALLTSGIVYEQHTSKITTV